MKQTFLFVLAGCLALLLGFGLFGFTTTVAAQDVVEEPPVTAPPEGAPVQPPVEEIVDAEEEEVAAEEVAVVEETPEPAVEDDPEPELAATEPELEDAATLEADLAAAEEHDVAMEEPIEEEEEEGEQLPWRNSSLLWDHSLNTIAFDPGSVITPNPSYFMTWTFLPRWYLNDDLSIRLRQDLSIELTDTDSRARNREPVLADTRLELIHAKWLEVEDFALGGGVRVYLPLSIASRARRMYFRPGVIVSGSYTVEDVMEGLSLGVTSTYDYRVAGSNVALREEDPYVQNFAATQSGADLAGQAGSSAQVDHNGTIGLSAGLTLIENLGVSTSFTWWWQNAGGIADAEVPIASAPGGVVRIEDGSASRTRLNTWFTLGVDYQFTDWLNLELGYGNLTGEFNPSASRRNPFWSSDSTVSLTAGFTLDKLYGAFVGSDSAVADNNDEGAVAGADLNRGNQ